MSEREVAIVRRGFEAFGRRDYPAMLADFAPDVEWYPSLGQLTTDVIHRGHEAIARMVRDIDEYLSFEMTPEDFVDLGDQVMVPVRAHGTGRGSGVELDESWVQLYTLREGKVIRVESFPDRDAALAAAGAERG